jgi:hypothetical protein
VVKLPGGLVWGRECSRLLAGLGRTALARSDHVTVSAAQFKDREGWLVWAFG